MSTEVVAKDEMALASVKTVNDAAQYAKGIAEELEGVADQAQTTLTNILEDSIEAHEWAGEAKTQASAANSYAVGALNSLSTTQDIIGVLNWVEESIKYVWDYPPTVEDKEYDPSKQYYTVIGKRVIDPIETDYDKYYVLNSESEPASKTGNIVTFDSDLDNFPLKSLTATINPKQAGSGDPSPDNVRPISGWDSVNAYVTDEQKYDRSNVVIGKNWIGGTDATRATLTFDAEPSTRYRVITKGGNFSTILFIRMEDYTQITNIGINPPFDGYITTESNCNKVIVQFQKDTAITADDFSDFKCSISKECESYTTNLPETVYGGSLDVVNGVLTVDRAMVTLGNVGNINTSATGTGKYVSWNAGMTLKANGKILCDRMKGITFAQRGTAYECYQGNADSVYFQAFVPSDATVQSVNDALSGSIAIVTLAEPRTIQLTPTQINTLLGTNNVWSDSGDVTIEYWDGPVGYVTPTSSFDPTETYYTVKGSPVKIDESKQEDHGKGLYYVHDLTNAKEAMADFIKARLALTDKGLYVVGGDTENEGYKILLASDGMTVYDAQGVAVSKFGENIEFSSTRAQYIGGETAYIVFNPEDGTINAGGEGFRFNNNMTLSDMLAEVGKIGGEDGLEQSTEDLLQKTKSISYENGKLIISGGENSNMKLVMESDRIGFYDGENEVAYISNNQMCIPRSIVLDSLDMGDNKWRWTLNTDDHLTLQWIGG